MGSRFCRVFRSPNPTCATDDPAPWRSDSPRYGIPGHPLPHALSRLPELHWDVGSVAPRTLSRMYIWSHRWNPLHRTPTYWPSPVKSSNPLRGETLTLCFDPVPASLIGGRWATSAADRVRT